MYEDFTPRAPRFPFWFRQVHAGPHDNFHYAFGDKHGSAAALVDPAFELDRLVQDIEEDGRQIEAAIFTHGHWDHIGGIPEVVGRGADRIYIHEAAAGHAKVLEAQDAGARVHLLSHGDEREIAGVPVRVLHTPGHQPESACYQVGPPGGKQALFTGDTLFVGRSGRTDFDGGDTEAMFRSMQRLRALEGDLVVLPGHHYADVPWIVLDEARETNPALVSREWEEFEPLPFLHGPTP